MPKRLAKVSASPSEGNSSPFTHRSSFLGDIFSEASDSRLAPVRRNAHEITSPLIRAIAMTSIGVTSWLNSHRSPPQAEKLGMDDSYIISRQICLREEDC